MNQQFEIEKEQLHNTAQGETDFWRARSAQFNMLHQQLQKPAVMRIRNIMNAKESHDNNALEEFDINFKEFSK
jgi:hypothetical protein